MTSLFKGTLLFEALRYDDLRVRTKRKALYIVRSSISQQSEVHGTIHVPEGLMSDLASIPDVARAYLDKDDPVIAMPSIIHDYLYSVAGKLPDGRTLTRKDSDELLRVGMIACGARSSMARVVYLATRVGGRWSWGKEITS